MRDGDRGGRRQELLTKNLNLCISEKSRKTLKIRDRCDAWWLILIDYIALMLTEEERALIIESCPIQEPFVKIVLLHPNTKKPVLEYSI